MVPPTRFRYRDSCLSAFIKLISSGFPEGFMKLGVGIPTDTSTGVFDKKVTGSEGAQDTFYVLREHLTLAGPDEVIG